MAQTIVYVDGFNLYYRALKNTKHKWLDLVALCRASLPRWCVLTRVNYYTARVSGRIDPGAPARQHAYLRALSTFSLIQIHYGKFMVNDAWAPLARPPDFRPKPTIPAHPAPVVARVIKTEEKGSDVNLGVHLVRDGLTSAFDEAAVLTNDTDLVEAIATEARKTVYLLTPVAKPATSLSNIATHVRHIRPYVGACQLPPTLTTRSGRTVAKPAAW